MPEVMMLLEYPSLNGGERSMLDALDGVLEAGFRLTAAAPPAGPLAGVLSARGVEILPMRWRGADGVRRDRDTLRDELRGVIGRVSPDLVHANSLSMSRLAGPVLAGMGIPGIGHLRDILTLTPAAVSDLNCHARLIAVSRATREWHVAQGLDARRTRVQFNGVDLERFRPRPPTGYLHRELGLAPHAKLVGSIGQIGMRKGLDLLLHAASHVVAIDPDVHFVLVGERFSQKDEACRFESDLRRVCSAASLAGHVHFLGHRDDVDRLLGELTLLAHAARQEPLGRVLLEAAAAGVPVVATDVGGTREIFPPGNPETAVVVPPNDADALAGEIAALLADEPRRAAMRSAARRRAEQAFDARVAGRAIAAHYRQVLAVAAP